MKRDLDLIRSLLLNVESDGEHTVPAGHTNEEIADHVQQLIEEGLVEGTAFEGIEVCAFSTTSNATTQTHQRSQTCSVPWDRLERREHCSTEA